MDNLENLKLARFPYICYASIDRISSKIHSLKKPGYCSRKSQERVKKLGKRTFQLNRKKSTIQNSQPKHDQKVHTLWF